MVGRGAACHGGERWARRASGAMKAEASTALANCMPDSLHFALRSAAGYILRSFERTQQACPWVLLASLVRCSAVPGAWGLLGRLG